MGIFFRDREEDVADPDLRASRYFLFKNKQTEENKLKVAERKYGYTLAELHAYKHVMKPPQMPEGMQQERPEMAYMYDQIRKLVEFEEYEQYSENHFATKPEGKPWVRGKALDETEAPVGACDSQFRADDFILKEGNGANAPPAVDESCVKCLGYYLALDRCVRAVSKKDEKNRVYKYTRLHACKPHWIWFKRCTGYRDQQLLKEISSWEGEYVKTLKADERQAYAENLLGLKRYLEYASTRSRDDVEVIRMQREASHLAARIEKLLGGSSTS